MPFECGDQPCGPVLPPKPLGMIICGARRSGKSNILIYMLKTAGLMLGEFEEIYLMSKSSYQPLMQSVKWTGVKDTFDEGWIDKKIEEQKRDMTRTGMAKEILIVLDDMVASEGFHKSKSILELAAVGRHYRINWIVLTQAMKGVGKSVRDNCDAIICFAMVNAHNRYSFYEEWALAGSWATFNKIFCMCTKEKHDFMFVNKANLETPYHHKFTPLRIIAKVGCEAEAQAEGDVIGSFLQGYKKEDSGQGATRRVDDDGDVSVDQCR